MFEDLRNLFPMYRTLVGPAVEATLHYLKEQVNQDMAIEFFSEQSSFGGWPVPEQWTCDYARLETADGQRVCDFSDNNFCVVVYSRSLNKTGLKYEELLHYLHVSELPHAKPYVTSYFQNEPGFCLSKSEFDALNPNSLYNLEIRSRFEKGRVPIAQIYYPGKSDRDLMFTSYVCHPQMANNELSGPVVLMHLSKWLKKLAEANQLHYGVRILLYPETIGSVAVINNYSKELAKVVAGFVVSCVGDDGPFSHIESPLGNNPADQLVSLTADSQGISLQKFDWLQRGSCERNYCWPTPNLPFCGISRSKYGTYAEYHTSADDLSFISERGLEGSLEFLKSLVVMANTQVFPKAVSVGEPFMTPLFADLAMHELKNKLSVRRLIDFLSYCDGQHSLAVIGRYIRSDSTETQVLLDQCLKLGLVDRG